MLKHEDIENISKLSSEITDCKWINIDRYGFSREYQFAVRGTTYVIEWYANYSILWCGELSILFDNFEYNGCWPDHFKNDLRFTFNGNMVAILPVEEWERNND